MKQLLKYLAFCTIAVLLNSCNDSESDLLEAKVYFESKEHTIEVLDDKPIIMNYNPEFLLHAPLLLKYAIALQDRM